MHPAAGQVVDITMMVVVVEVVVMVVEVLAATGTARVD